MTDHTEIVWELKAIRKSLDNLPAKMASAFGLMALLLAALILLACKVKESPKLPPSPPPPETQFDGLDLHHPPVATVASRGGSHGPCRRNPVCKTLASTSERPRPGQNDRAVPEWICLSTYGPGWGPWTESIFVVPGEA
jgi:hypothetical protein